MAITDWLEGFRKRFPAAAPRRRRPKQRRYAERLEDRTLLSLSASFSSGLLDVNLDDGDSLVIEADGDVVIAGTTEITVTPGDVTAIDVEDIATSDQANSIDLPAVSTGNNYTGLDGDITIQGGSGNDSVKGSLFADSILADNGDDTVDGRDGDDTIEGNAGADSLVGSIGADSLLGNSAADRIDGDDGDDTI